MELSQIVREQGCHSKCFSWFGDTRECNFAKRASAKKQKWRHQFWSRFHFYLDCHNPRIAPVGSRMKLSHPMPATSVTSFMISPPTDSAFFVAAQMSSTPT